MGFESAPPASEPPKRSVEREQHEDERATTSEPHPDWRPERTGEARPDEGHPLAAFREALAELRLGRDPHKEIDAEAERARIVAGLERVSEMMEDMSADAPSVSAVSSASEAGGGTKPATLPELQEVRKEFEQEAKKVELAEQYNDVLESLARYDDEELQSVCETGRTKDGRQVRNKRNEALAPEVAKHLADLARHGVRRLTWGSFNRMLQLFDALLKDFFAPLKELKRLIGMRG